MEPRLKKPPRLRFRRPSFSTLLRWGSRLVLIAIVLYLLAAGVIMLAGLREDAVPADMAHPADVGVVFGNKVEPWGEPSPSLASRLDKAVALYQRGAFSQVLVSGGLGKEGWDEAQVMADYLAARGVPREVILVDGQGNNTYLTALHTAQLAKDQGWRSFVLVSHFYHLPRARLAFERFGLTPVSIAHADRYVPRDFYYGLLREVIAYPAYWLRAYEE